MQEAPTPIAKPNSDIKSIKLLKEFFRKDKNNQEEFLITLGILNNSIKITIKEGINIFNGQFNLKDLQEKDKYFRMFDSIEEAYKELLHTFSENQYNLKREINYLILNVEIDISHKKSIIPFILQKNELKNDELIKPLYMIINNYTKENNGLKEDIINLTNKVNQIEQKFNSLENKIDILLNYMSDKKEKEKEEKKEKEKDNLFLFENSLGKSKIIENKEQILLLKNWLPYQNKNKLKCRLIYDGKRDGDKASTFHSLCDNKESTLTLISTSDNRKIGGFLSKPFGGNKGFIIDTNAFLFNLNYNEKYPSLNKGNHYNDLENQGPIFGSVCIRIEDNFLSNNQNYYHPFTARYDFGSRNDNTNYYFKVIDLEVYQIFE